MGKIRIETFCAPPPLIKVETFLTPPQCGLNSNETAKQVRALQVKLDIRIICLI